MMFETLETRRLLSVSFNATTGVVTVTGRSYDVARYYVATAKVSAGQFVVGDNGATRSFPAASVKRVVVTVGGGPFDVRLDPSVTVPSSITVAAVYDSSPRSSVRGGSGPDTIRVAALTDVYGGAGNDTFLIDSAGAYNSVWGEAGNDVFRTSSPTESGLHGGTGSDTLDYSGYGSGGSGLGIRNGRAGRAVSGGPALPPAAYDGDGFDGMDAFIGTDSNDFIYGTSGANYIDGRGGNDYVRGGGGNDVLVGGPGADALYGDDGDDQFFTRDGGTKDFLRGGAGYDRRRSDAIDVLNSVEGTV